jgi:hypothetical protein
LTASIRRQGFSRTRKFIRHPRTAANQVQTITRRMDEAQRANILDVVPAKPTGRRKAPPDDRFGARRDP